MNLCVCVSAVIRMKVKVFLNVSNSADMRPNKTLQNPFYNEFKKAKHNTFLHPDFKPESHAPPVQGFH